MAKECKCGDPVGHAKAVESAIMNSLFNAGAFPDREAYWRSHADLLEGKFTTGHGKHYSHFLYKVK
ncbi:hypothetical protein PQD74_gp013 [Stenotrophomonas phage Siara]|uniref:Uncharacterized protein n=1 Tax=Stenotrophomonas phage Siara TaxID=2859658 RepID=A0AAE7WM54_9CAUD|nr:hypothetical protein PQD74_gp013 [Stenotrophomonas phage Siara]QYW02016.1 hypothetical protein CPT_Siara_013 [Stenotrophomonas phage Siara]